MSTSDGDYERDDGAEYRRERDPAERPSEAVVAAMTDVSGKPVVPNGANDEREALAPLYEAVDPDALDALFLSDRGRESDRSVTFTYESYRVSVGDRAVRIVPLE